MNAFSPPIFYHLTAVWWEYSLVSIICFRWILTRILEDKKKRALFIFWHRSNRYFSVTSHTTSRTNFACISNTQEIATYGSQSINSYKIINNQHGRIFWNVLSVRFSGYFLGKNGCDDWIWNWSDRSNREIMNTHNHYNRIIIR